MVVVVIAVFVVVVVVVVSEDISCNARSLSCRRFLLIVVSVSFVFLLFFCRIWFVVAEQQQQQ